MGRGPGPSIQTIGFNVSAFADGDDQQAVQIVRSGTNVATTAGATQALGDFNQIPSLPLAMSNSGNTFLVAGTNVANPKIGGILPAGTGTVQPVIKITAGTFSSPGTMNKGFVNSSKVGTAAGTLGYDQVVDDDGKPLMAYKITYLTSVAGATKPSYVNNGAAALESGIAPTQVNDEDLIGLGTYTGVDDPVWLNIQKRDTGQAGASEKLYNMQTGAEVTDATVVESMQWETGAETLLYGAVDTMMQSQYALGGANARTTTFISKPVMNQGADTFTGETPGSGGLQVSLTEQSIGGGTGGGTLNVGPLYDFAVGDVSIPEVEYKWADATSITNGQIYGVRIDGKMLTDYTYDQETVVDGKNNYEAEATVPAALGFGLYKTNANLETDEGLSFVSYAVAGELTDAAEDQGAPDPQNAEWAFSTALTVGTLVVNYDSNYESGCGTLTEVSEGTGSVELRVCGGEDIVSTKFSIKASF